MRLAFLFAALTLRFAAFADDDLTPDKTAKIERDKTKAMEDIDKKYGNKKSSELTSDERRAQIADRAAAEQQVFDKNGVTAKGYTAYTSKMNKEDRAATKAADAKLQAKEKADAEAAAAAKKQAAAGPKEIPVQRGFNDNNPVVLEEKQGGEVVVEKGLPQDYQDDQSSAAGMNNDAPAAPAAGKGKKK